MYWNKKLILDIVNKVAPYQWNAETKQTASLAKKNVFAKVLWGRKGIQKVVRPWGNTFCIMRMTVNRPLFIYEKTPQGNPGTTAALKWFQNKNNSLL